MKKPLEKAISAKPDTKSPAETTATATATATTGATATSGVSATTAAAGAATVNSVPALQIVNVFTPNGNYQLISTTPLDSGSMAQIAGPLLFSQQSRERYLAHEMAGLAEFTAAQLVEVGDHYLIKHGNPIQAIRYYTAAIEKDANLLVAYQQRVNAYVASKNFSKAMIDADFVLQQDSNNFEMLKLKAVCLFNLERHVECIPIFELMATLRPKCVDSYSGMMGAILEESTKTRKFDAKKLKICAEKTIELGSGLDIIFGKAVLQNLQNLMIDPVTTVNVIQQEVRDASSPGSCSCPASAAAEARTAGPKPK